MFAASYMQCGQSLAISSVDIGTFFYGQSHHIFHQFGVALLGSDMVEGLIGFVAGEEGGGQHTVFDQMYQLSD